MVEEVLRMAGEPLDSSTRAFMESRLGHDFGPVRVHTDAGAAESARVLNAAAYAAGTDVVFGPNAYAPGTSDGKRLIAHELVHVLQQSAGVASRLGAAPLLQRQGAGDVPPGCGSAFKSQFKGVINAELPEKHNRVARKYWVLVRQGGSVRRKPTDEPLATGAEVDVGQKDGLWRAVCYKATGMPLQILWVLDAYIDRKPAEAEGKPASLPGTAAPPQAAAPEAPQAEPGPGATDASADDGLAQAGLVAAGTALERQGAPAAEALRAFYNEGAARIAAEGERLAAQGVSEAEIAQRLAAMRHQLAEEVRRMGSALTRRAAEVFDSVRGNVGRPTYETLKAAGKTDAEIIESASRTNAFVNKLPKGIKWTGRALVFVSAGISIVLIVSAPPGQRQAVAEREIGGFVGGVGGAEIGAGICVLFGIATEGLGLVVCGVLGGIAGTEAGRKLPLLQILDIAPHTVPSLAGQLHRVQGTWDETDLFVLSIPHRTVEQAENVLVIATGRVSGELVSGRGHYREYEVIPANDAATQLFGSINARFVPNYLLVPASSEDLRRNGER